MYSMCAEIDDVAGGMLIIAKPVNKIQYKITPLKSSIKK